MKKFRLILAVTAFISLGMFGCNGGNTNNDISKIVFPDTDVSYNTHVRPVIAANCALSNCHGVVTGPNAAPMYDYYTLVQDTRNLGVVWPGQPEASTLVRVIEYTQMHYPNYTWNINANQRAGIRKWITEGAKNN
jgi:hypothetical protein